VSKLVSIVWGGGKRRGRNEGKKNWGEGKKKSKKDEDFLGGTLEAERKKKRKRGMGKKKGGGLTNLQRGPLRRGAPIRRKVPERKDSRGVTKN